MSPAGASAIPAGTDRRQAGGLETQQDVVLAPADAERELLQRVEDAINGEEPDEMAGRPDGQLAEGELVGRPLGERLLPRQLDERDGRVTEAKARESRHVRGRGDRTA